MANKVTIEAAIKGEVDNAINKFRSDLGFTAPELYDMRIDQLRLRLHQVAHIIAEMAGSDG